VRYSRQAKTLKETFDGIFLSKAGNRARKYHYGPGFQKHPVAKMRFDLEGQIWGVKGQMRSNFQKKLFCLVLSYNIESGKNH